MSSLNTIALVTNYVADERGQRQKHTKILETSTAVCFPHNFSIRVRENSMVVPGPRLVTIFPSISTLDSLAVAQVAASFSINTG